MKYFSTFSGIGGFELGIQQAYEKLCIKNKRQRLQGARDSKGQRVQRSNICANGLTCVGYSEIDKYAIQIYQKHFPNHKNYGDITTINEKELPDFDLLVGGFPCQSFSIAGKRAGFEDTRGTMFFHLARILREKQPRLFIFENVKGLLSHDQGRTFHTIITALDELGYDCQWQVLNSKNHGVPQNRERVFIIGHLRGTPRPEVFPFTGQGNSNTTISKSAKTAVARTLTGGGHTGGNHSGMTIIQINQPKHSNDRVYGTEGLSPTINTMQGGNRQPFIAAERGRYNEDGSTSQKLEARKDNLSNTLTGVEKDNRVVENAKIRRLTPTECERLQGFPDGWTQWGEAHHKKDGVNLFQDMTQEFEMSDTQRYKTLGNAVTVNIIRDIMSRLL